MDWLANITLPYILAAVAVLFIARLYLGRYKSRLAKQASEAAESLLIAVVLVFLVIRPFIVQAFYIPSGSMIPTLYVRDHILVNKFIYRFSEPKHGDIVVFKSPPGVSNDGQERDFIKRLIGVPGDTIRVSGGCVEAGGVRYDHGKLKKILFGDDPWGAPDHVVKLTKDGAYVDGQFINREELAKDLDVSNPAKLRIAPGIVIRNGKPLDESFTQEDPDYDMAPVKVPPGMLFVMGDNRNLSNDSHVWGTLDRNRVLGKALVRFWPLNRLGIPR